MPNPRVHSTFRQPPLLGSATHATLRGHRRGAPWSTMAAVACITLGCVSAPTWNGTPLILGRDLGVAAPRAASSVAECQVRVAVPSPPHRARDLLGTVPTSFTCLQRPYHSHRLFDCFRYAHARRIAGVNSSFWTNIASAPDVQLRSRACLALCILCLPL